MHLVVLSLWFRLPAGSSTANNLVPNSNYSEYHIPLKAKKKTVSEPQARFQVYETHAQITWKYQFNLYRVQAHGHISADFTTGHGAAFQLDNSYKASRAFWTSLDEQHKDVLAFQTSHHAAGRTAGLLLGTLKPESLAQREKQWAQFQPRQNLKLWLWGIFLTHYHTI